MSEAPDATLSGLVRERARFREHLRGTARAIWSVVQRPQPRQREQLIATGGADMSAEELLAVVLGTGAAGRSALALATDLVTRTGGLAALSTAGPDELTAVPGIGMARAARVTAAFQLGRRAARDPRPVDQRIHGAEHVYQRMRGRLAEHRQELFVSLALDARNAVIAEIEVARGTLTGVEVHPREVFRPLIRLAAAATVLVHNHPSGDPTPSPEDVELTRRLAEVGDLVGIPVLDHVVVARGGFRSLAEHLA